MEGWKEIVLDSQSTYIKGRIGWQGLKASEFLEEGPYLVTGTDFLNGDVIWDTCYHISESRFKEASYIHLQNDDLLITKDGTIGKVAYVKNCPSKAVLNSGIFLVRCIDNSYLHKFLFYVLNSEHFIKFLLDNQGGSTIKHLYQRSFVKFSFNAPIDLNEQKKITEILSELDKGILQTEQLITKYKNIKRGLMQDLLTFGIDENGSIRKLQTHYFVEKMGVLVPHEWDVKRIDELASVTGGKRLPEGHAYSAINTGFRYLRVTDFYNKKVDYANLENIEKRTFNKLERYEILPSDLFISIAGSIGYIGVNKPDISDRIILTENALRISVYEKIIPDFLSMQMNSEVVQKQIWAEIGTGGGVPKLAKHRVESLYIPYPKWNGKYDEQKKIVSILEQQDKLIDSEQTNLNKLQMLKQGLMQDLLTGKVRVNL